MEALILGILCLVDQSTHKICSKHLISGLFQLSLYAVYIYIIILCELFEIESEP